MGLRKALAGLVDRIQAHGLEAAERAYRTRHPVDAVLAWSLDRAESAGTLHYPVQYLQFLRDCTESARANWVEIRNDLGQEDGASRRFASLVHSLRNLPAVEFGSAERLARAADGLRANLNPATGQREHGDRQRWFSITASLGVKGRILYNVVKVMESRHVIELGTYLGMSTMFLLEALDTAGPEAHVTTIELHDKYHSIASALLDQRFKGRVTCIQGLTEEVVPELGRTMTGVDLMFHDAGHTGENYVRDFKAAEPSLASGAVLLFDDIRWRDPSVATSDPRCHDGWMEVTRHPRVRRAGEIDEYMGALLLR